MHLRIRGPDNQIDLDDVESTWTVQKLRETIAGKLSPAVPPERLKLILMGRVIRDEQTLEELHLEDDHVVHMVVRPDGVPPSPAPQAENPIPPQPRMGTFNVFSLDGSGNGTATQGTIGGADLGGLLAGLLGGATAAFTSIHPQPRGATVGTASANPPSTTASGRVSRTASNMASPTAGPSANPAGSAEETTSPTGNLQFFPGLPFPMAFGLPGGLSGAPQTTPANVRPLHQHIHHFGGPHGHGIHHHNFHHQAHMNAHHAAQVQMHQQRQAEQQQAATAAAAAAMAPSNNTNVSGVQVHLHVSLAELDQVPAALQRLNQNLSGSVDVRVVNSGSGAASAMNSSANAAAAAASASGRSLPAPATASSTTRTAPQVSTQALSRPAPAAPASAAASSKAPHAAASSSSSSSPTRSSRPQPPGTSFAQSIADTINGKMRVPHELLELMSGQYGALIRIQPDIERTIRAELKKFAESSAGIAAAGAGADPDSAAIKHAWMMGVSQDIVTKCLLEHPGAGGNPLAALFHNTHVKSSWRSDLHILACIKRAVYSFLEKVVLGKFINAKLPTQVSEQTVRQLQIWAKEVHDACVMSVGCFINFLGDEYFQLGPSQAIHVIQTCITALFPVALTKFFPLAVPFEEVLGRFLTNNVGNWAELYRQLMNHSKASDFETFKQDKPAPAVAPRPSVAASSSSAVVSPTVSEQDRILNDALKDDKGPTTPPGEKRPRE